MKIVVVGGGTAGWLSALIISKVFKGIHQITLIESKYIKTIGVGEGSTAFLRGVINNEIWDFGCNQYDFMKFSNATPKLGVLFKDWQSQKSQYIEPIDFSLDVSKQFSDTLLLDSLANNDKIHIASMCGNFIEKNKVPFLITPNGYESANAHAFHFDSNLAAQYFEKVCQNDVEKIYGNIIDFDLSENGSVSSLILEDGYRIDGDFFIDASGFKRIFAKKMNVKFLKYEELTLNSAVPFVLDKEQFSNTNSYTTSWAKKYGWMWMIPKTDVVGCGYIYDDNFINEDQAKTEIENSLGLEIDVSRIIKFTAGRQESFWNNNVLSVGLSSNFLEPLEATSIHGTIAQIYNFVFSYLKNTIRDTMNKKSIELYNKETSLMIDNFRDFILFHYSLTRSDTKFWQNMQTNANENGFINHLIDISKSRLLNEYDINLSYGGAGFGLFNWVASALGFISKDVAIAEIDKPGRKNQAEEAKKYIFDFFSNNYWEDSTNFIRFLERKDNV